LSAASILKIKKIDWREIIGGEQGFGLLSYSGHQTDTFQASSRHRFAARQVLFLPLARPTVYVRHRHRLARIDDGTGDIQKTS
jgi:hypothetical protein